LFPTDGVRRKPISFVLLIQLNHRHGEEVAPTGKQIGKLMQEKIVNFFPSGKKAAVETSINLLFRVHVLTATGMNSALSEH
jgi:hypothetical protein